MFANPESGPGSGSESDTESQRFGFRVRVRILGFRDNCAMETMHAIRSVPGCFFCRVKEE